MVDLIQLENFRNHKKKEFKLSKINIITGKNGVGKSNVLEAISLISCCRSFREEDKKNLINYEADYARVKTDEFEVFIQKNPRQMLRTKYRNIPKRKIEYIGLLPSVTFSPETMSIIIGGPSERRRFLDVMVSQVDLNYLEALSSYEKIRLQRNNLLQMISEGRSKRDELSFWDSELMKWGSVIIKKRELVVRYLNTQILKFYQEISNTESIFMLEYVRSVQDDFLSQLKLIREREIACGFTQIGPHRDDLKITLDNKEMAKFASRGEVRSAILALKIAEINFIKENSKNQTLKPILLLDDVLSEFDMDRRHHLFKLIKNYQTVITTTEKEFIDAELLVDANVIELK